MPVIDVVTVPVKPGTNVLDSNTPEAKAFAGSLQILVRQDGYKEAWYGYRVEDASKLMLFMNWDSIEHHVRFGESSDHEALIKSLSMMLAGRPSSYHVEFQSRMTQVIAFGAPVTEIAEARVQEKTADLDQDAAALINAVKESGAGLVGASTGWSVEDMEDEKLDVKGKIFMLAVGWKSVDAHMKARETERLQEYHWRSEETHQVHGCLSCRHEVPWAPWIVSTLRYREAASAVIDDRSP